MNEAGFGGRCPPVFGGRCPPSLGPRFARRSLASEATPRCRLLVRPPRRFAAGSLRSLVFGGRWCRSWIVLVGVCAVALGGCFDPMFDRSSEVKTWRGLAIVAEPPVVGLDRDVQLRALVVMPDGTHVAPSDTLAFEWVACIRPERVPGLSSSQFDPEVESNACGGFPSLPLVTAADGSAVMSVSSAALGAVLAPDRLDEVAALLGITTELLTEIFERVGITVVVELDVCELGEGAHRCADDGAVRRVTAYKRVLVRDLFEDDLGHNPPPPRFGLRLRDEEVSANRWIVDDPSAPFLCIAEDGAPVSLAASTEHIVDPEDVGLEPGPDSWLENYTVLDLAGGFTDVQERAYYSYYSTGGNLAQETTRAPADEEVWTTPEDPGTYPLWVVVRDGHGGTSACRLDVVVM